VSVQKFNIRFNFSSFQSFIRSVLSFSVALFLGLSSASGQEMKGMKMDSSSVKQEDMMDMQTPMSMPMAFFTHMGVPLSVGTYSLRAAALLNQYEGVTTGDCNFQFETGLSKTVGLFLGGDKLIADPTLEVMFQFLVFASKNGMSGLSPIIEFEFPLGEEAPRHFYTLVGIAGTFSNSRLGFNQVIHYSPLEDLVEGSASLVVKVSKRIFLVSEISGVVAKGAYPIYEVLGGVKVKLNKNFLLGFAFQLPLTENRDFSSQYVFQPNVLLGK
jgi:hypothetical protein